jgi:hypothetical protein
MPERYFRQKIKLSFVLNAVLSACTKPDCTLLKRQQFTGQGCLKIPQISPGRSNQSGKVWAVSLNSQSEMWSEGVNSGRSWMSDRTFQGSPAAKTEQYLKIRSMRWSSSSLETWWRQWKYKILLAFMRNAPRVQTLGVSLNQSPFKIVLEPLTLRWNVWSVSIQKFSRSDGKQRGILFGIQDSVDNSARAPIMRPEGWSSSDCMRRVVHSPWPLHNGSETFLCFYEKVPENLYFEPIGSGQIRSSGSRWNLVTSQEYQSANQNAIHTIIRNWCQPVGFSKATAKQRYAPLGVITSLWQQHSSCSSSIFLRRVIQSLFSVYILCYSVVPGLWTDGPRERLYDASWCPHSDLFFYSCFF